MLVSATEIARWAGETRARAELPRLLRKLIHATAEAPKLVDIPAGEGADLPGWDGIVHSKSESAWVPEGRSYWEFSCRSDVSAKANEDYAKRVNDETLSLAQRETSTFLFVSARSWPTRRAWEEAKRSSNEWRDVRAYDAGNLEQWLEQAPAVSLWFAEELGLAGEGVQSLPRYLERWRSQCEPVITADALLNSRENERQGLVELLTPGRQKTVTIQADSVEEAVAFGCAVVGFDERISNSALVVTDRSGWRFVDKNPGIRLAIAAQSSLAEFAQPRANLTVLVPWAAGDPDSLGGVGSDGEKEIVLLRPNTYQFEESLVSIGVVAAEARRLAESTGRSWSIFRRLKAKTTAFRQPAWIDKIEARVLPTVCLLGAWTETEADQSIVASLTRRRYEEVESDLRALVNIDDAPVVQIGKIWKAKSALELLYLFGDRITGAELDRFFAASLQLLSETDPQLDLPDDKRWMAAVYDKGRPQSGLLLNALTDSLIKLAVRGPMHAGLRSKHISQRVDALVRDLLGNADDTRWLSLASLLPALAEAAPTSFLNAVDKSLGHPEQPVTRLITETGSSSGFGRCWHAGLLWALELVAWDPAHLARVSQILAQLCKTPIKGNWGNTPLRTLLSLYRSWLPRTSATIEQRISALRHLVDREPNVAFELVDGLLPIGQDHAMSNSTPKWRATDANASNVTIVERNQMLACAADILISLGSGNPERLARLFKKIDRLDEDRVASVLTAIERLSRSYDDSGKETVRRAIAEHLHWHRAHGNETDEVGSPMTQKLQALHEALTPADLVVRHAWLFASSWPRLPNPEIPWDHTKENDHILAARLEALRELLANEGLSGIERLVLNCQAPHWVGTYLTKLELRSNQTVNWIVDSLGWKNENDSRFRDAIHGLLGCLPESALVELSKEVVAEATSRAWKAKEVADFLALAPSTRSIWSLVADQGRETEQAYWAIIRTGRWFNLDSEDLRFGVNQLLIARRARSALAAAEHQLDKLGCELLAQLLENVLEGDEPEFEIDHWGLCDAVKHLEANTGIEPSRLARLEFQLLPALGLDKHELAITLFREITTDPELFVYLLSSAFRGDGEPQREHTEQDVRRAELALEALHECRRLPGQADDGSIDSAAMISFINRARECTKETGHTGIGDTTLGQIIAHAPADEDGAWPCRQVADVIERCFSETLGHGFVCGVHNSRGMTSRGPYDGGNQERVLADRYRSWAKAYHNSCPRVAALLDKVAESYDNDARRQDDQARLSRERH